MNRKKTLLTLLAMAAVCVVSVTGTFAYLTKTTAAVTNTFVAAGGGKLLESGGDFQLKEHKATPVKVENAAGQEIPTGAYEIGTDAGEVTEQTYAVVPGVDIPKDPWISITGKTELPAYLYIEVVDGAKNNTNIKWEIDERYWKELDGVASEKGGTVYVYRNEAYPNGAVIDDTTDLNEVNIIKDQKIEIANTSDTGLGQDGLTIQFYGYLAQAVVTSDGGNSTDPAEVFRACFGTNP